jgi:hypothetical protein
MLRHHNPEDNTVDTCSERDWEAEEKEKLVEKKLKEKPSSDDVYKSRQNQNEILESVLSRHPEITKAQMQEVMDWAELKGGLSPFEVEHLLSQMKGLTKTTATLVAQKYSAYLSKAAQEGDAEIRMFISNIPQYQSQPQTHTFTAPTQFPPTYPSIPSSPINPTLPYPSPTLSPQQPYNEPREKPLTMKDVLEILERRERMKEEESRLDKIEKTIEKLVNTIKEEKTKSQETQPNVLYEVIEEPVDENGNVCSPEKAVSIRRRTVPLTREEKRESVLDIINALKNMGVIGQKDGENEGDRMDILNIIAFLKELGIVGQQGISQESIEQIIERKLERPTLTPEEVKNIVEQAVDSKIQRKEITPEDIEKIIEKRFENKRLSPEEVDRIIAYRLKDEEMKRLKSDLEDMKKKYTEVTRLPPSATPEERLVEQQRMLLENVGDTTKHVVSKVLDSVTPIMLRQAGGGYPPQSQLPTYTDDEINKIAESLEKGVKSR